jgi:hypothetical protein
VWKQLRKNFAPTSGIVDPIKAPSALKKSDETPLAATTTTTTTTAKPTEKPKQINFLQSHQQKCAKCGKIFFNMDDV